MKPNFGNSEREQSSKFIQHSSNAEMKTTKASDRTLDNTENSEDSISVTIESSKRPFSISQLAVLGVLTVAVTAMFFLVTRGNDFCFFSICNDFPYQNPIVYSFWSAAGGLGAFGILALLGASAPIAIIGGLATWFLMQISLH